MLPPAKPLESSEWESLDTQLNDEVNQKLRIEYTKESDETQRSIIMDGVPLTLYEREDPKAEINETNDSSNIEGYFPSLEFVDATKSSPSSTLISEEPKRKRNGNTQATMEHVKAQTQKEYSTCVENVQYIIEDEKILEIETPQETPTLSIKKKRKPPGVRQKKELTNPKATESSHTESTNSYLDPKSSLQNEIHLKAIIEDGHLSLECFEDQKDSIADCASDSSISSNDEQKDLADLLLTPMTRITRVISSWVTESTYYWLIGRGSTIFFKNFF